MKLRGAAVRVIVSVAVLTAALSPSLGAWAADPFSSLSCTGLVDAALVQCNGVVAMSAQLAALQGSIDSVVGLAGSLSVPLTALSSIWTEEGAYFFLGVALALVFVKAVGTRW